MRRWRDSKAGCLWTGGVGGDHGEIERRVVYGQDGRRPWRDREAGCLWTGGVGGEAGCLWTWEESDREAGCLWTGGVGGDHGVIERRVVYGQEGWEETME